MPQIYRFGGRYRSSTRVSAEEKTHIAKVARENVKGHSRRRLRDWNRCQDGEDQGDVTDADSTTDDRLEADRLGKTAVRVQRRQQTGANDHEHPADECCDDVFSRLLNYDARYDCNQADAIRQPKQVDASSSRRLVLACLEEDCVPVYQWADTSSASEDVRGVRLLRTAQGCQHHSHYEILEITTSARPLCAQYNGNLEGIVKPGR
jgi:hypothetical protein